MKKNNLSPAEEKFRFLMSIRKVIEEKPTWFADAIIALNKGMNDRLRSVKEDNGTLETLVLYVLTERRLKLKDSEKRFLKSKIESLNHDWHYNWEQFYEDLDND